MRMKIFCKQSKLDLCGQHLKRLDKNNSWIRTNQIQESRLTPEDKEVLIAILDTMTIQDMDPMEAQQGAD